MKKRKVVAFWPEEKALEPEKTESLLMEAEHEEHPPRLFQRNETYDPKYGVWRKGPIPEEDIHLEEMEGDCHGK